MVHFKVIWWYT